MHVCNIRLDLRKPDWDRPPVRVMRGDANATVIRATVLDGGSPVDLSRAQPRFECVKPDGTWVRELAQAKPGGVIEYVLPPQVSAVEGVIDGACFRVAGEVGEAGEVDSAGPFAIEVLPSIEGAGAGESGSYCPELDGLMDEMRQLIVDGGAKDYAALFGKPSINGRTLEGNMQLADIGILQVTNSDIEAMFNEKYREAKGL